jgi:predicted DNA-binding transcriptional regulator YafY
MPVTKNVLARFRILNACFANSRKRYWTISELKEKLSEYDINIERRTLEHDFEHMRYDDRLGYHAPIAYDKKEKGFYYTDPKFTIERLPLTKDDMDIFTKTINIIRQYKGVKLVRSWKSSR